MRKGDDNDEMKKKQICIFILYLDLAIAIQTWTEKGKNQHWNTIQSKQLHEDVFSQCAEAVWETSLKEIIIANENTSAGFWQE